MRYRLFLVILTCLLLVPAQLRADITFNVTFDDVVNNTNVGFDDPVFGATRRATVGAVFNYINTVVNENGTVDMTFNNSQTDGTGFLATAGPFFFTGPNGYANGFFFDHATTGVDPSGAVPDATSTFDFGYTWNNGLGAPGGSEFDLFSVALHEITHAAGFLSLLNSNGTGLNGTNPDVFSVYDSFLERGDGTALFGPGGTYLGNASDLTSMDVFFGGPNAMAANGGLPVPVYAPGTFVPGSSISHITPTNAVMQFSIGPGVQRRAYSAAEIGILADIGWTVIPEPSSLGLMIVGLTLISLRRRR